MYLGVFIDSENYTQLGCVMGDTLSEVKSKVEKYYVDDFDWSDRFVKMNGNKILRGVTEKKDDYNLWFAVAEIFDVDSDKYYLVYWHAYNGVDFDVTEFDSWDSAYDRMKCEYHDMIEDWEIDTNSNQCYIDSYSCVIDDDVEWHMMEIVTKGE